MKNIRRQFSNIFFAFTFSVVFVKSINAVLPIKKDSLSALKEKINASKQEKPVAHESSVKIKKNQKKFLFLEKIICYFNTKKEYAVKKIRLFYRRHFYLSVAGLGLFSIVLLCCLKQYGVPFLYSLIEKYGSRQKDLISIDQSIKAVDKSTIVVKEAEKIENRELNNDLAMQDAEKKEIVVVQDEKNLNMKSASQNEVLNVSDESLNQKSELNTEQNLQVNVPQQVMPVLTEIDLRRSADEINRSKNLYLRMKKFINEVLPNEVDFLKELKNQYEIAKKQAEKSPYNIQLHKNFLKKEQDFIKRKQETTNSVQKFIDQIDSSNFFNKHLILKDFVENDLGKTPKAVISEKRACAFNDAAAYEWYYSNLNKNENIELIQQNQRVQIRELGYVYGILNKVLLPFIQCL